MIDYRTVQKISIKENIPEETIEKDYLIELLISFMIKNSYINKNLVFRGGTALKKVYFPAFRYSEDLDFIVEPTILTGLPDKLTHILSKINKDMPLILTWNSQYPRKGHLQIYVNFNIIPEIPGEKKLKLDIIEDNTILPSRKKEINFYFPDFRKTTPALINTYKLESIAAEKIGRILDVVDEPRDLWDLHYLFKSGLMISSVQKLYRKKYGIDIPLPNLLNAIEKPNYKTTWEIRLKNNIPNLLPYKKLIGELQTFIRINF